MRQRNPLVLRFETAVQEYERVPAIREQASPNQPVSVAQLAIHATLSKPLTGLTKREPRQLNYCDRQAL
jgi:hypothetical protein